MKSSATMDLSIAKDRAKFYITPLKSHFIPLQGLSLLIGLLFAGQFPLLNVFDLDAGVYLTAIAISVLVIYGIVTLCALFPSWQAARIQPATALHEE